MLDVRRRITYSDVFMAPRVFLLRKGAFQRAGPTPAPAASH
jgi:hypothetical protein